MASCSAAFDLTCADRCVSPALVHLLGVFHNPNASDPEVREENAGILFLLALMMHREFHSAAEDQAVPLSLDDITFAYENRMYDFLTNELLERLDATSFPDFIKDAVREYLVKFMAADHGPA